MDAPSYPHAELVSCFNRLTQALSELARQLHASTLPLWLPLTDQEQTDNIDPRNKAIELYCDLWYRDDGDGRRTRSCHGLIAADDQLLAAAVSANQAKTAFRQAIADLKRDLANSVNNKQAPTVLSGILAHINAPTNSLRQSLGHKGLSRLHLKQCYRLIPTTAQHPVRVGLNWYTSGRSIKRITPKQAQQMLVKMGQDKPHIQLQLDRLNQLSADTPLAQVQQQAPLMRANLSYDLSTAYQASDSDDSIKTQRKTLRRQAMNLSLPLLFRYDSRLPFPDHNQPSLTPQAERQRQIRSDCRIQAEPFLPSLRLHLYF
ncbi:MAG: DNA replication terminus site-binding protein [Motiliproteus sp.]